MHFSSPERRWATERASGVDTNMHIASQQYDTTVRKITLNIFGYGGKADFRRSHHLPLRTTKKSLG
jgi:hypothetical protein